MTVRSAPKGAEVVARLAAGTRADAALVDDYYTLCIPFYREFLGHHWHTGWYLPDGPTGPADPLRMELRLMQDASIDAAGTVLDVGCGIGGPACHVAARTGARVVGLTPNTAQLELARRHAQERGVADRVSFEQGSADALPFEDASFDVVMFLESACHFPDRSAFFAEVRRVLRPGGRLVGEDWLAVAGARDGPLRAAVEAVEAHWALPRLGTLAEYAAAMQAAGLQLAEAADLRSEMPLHRGFVTQEADRAQLRAEQAQTRDPMRRQIMEALAVLGEAVEQGAFTVGRFRARRPAAP